MVPNCFGDAILNSSPAQSYISFDNNIKEHPEIIEQLNDSLKSLGELSSDLFVQLDEMLERTFGREQDLKGKNI